MANIVNMMSSLSGRGLLACHRRSSTASASSLNIHQSPTKFCGVGIGGLAADVTTRKGSRLRVGADALGNSRHRFPPFFGERIATIKASF
jgi:hypothetical protein